MQVNVEPVFQPVKVTFETEREWAIVKVALQKFSEDHSHFISDRGIANRMYVVMRDVEE